jgi:imidazolonepropionase-like amidohydrolase
VHNTPMHWDANPLMTPKSGGHFEWRVAENQRGAVFDFKGTYHAVHRPESLAFTWQWDYLPVEGIEGAGDTDVLVRLVPAGSDTRIELTQTGLPSRAARAAHLKGWNRCLDGMAELLTGTATPSPTFEVPLISVSSPVVALENILVIDGTGRAPIANQTILISHGTIAAIGNAAAVSIPKDATRLNYAGYTAIPGLVGMHDHLFYSADYFTAGDGSLLAHDMPYSFPALYLAGGVTTIRTTGSYEPYTDLEIKRAVDAGTIPGPKMNITGPYLEAEPFSQIQIHKLTGPEDARRTVDYWAAEGAGSFKVYTHITRAELSAAIEAAHRHKLTITGHLCSLGFREAAELGIDGVEHGLWADAEFAPDKEPDRCPGPGSATAVDLDIDSEPIRQTIQTLVAHHVAVTSTLAVWEEFIPTRPDAPQRVLDALSAEVRTVYLEQRRAQHATLNEQPLSPQGQTMKRLSRMFTKEMQFERAFARSGGLLLAGADGVIGGSIAGYADQRELELLVEAGFSAEEAIQIATLNGARFLGLSAQTGSLEVGKQADIAILKGNLSQEIKNVENVELVFKDGVGYESSALIDSVRGQVGIR